MTITTTPESLGFTNGFGPFTGLGNRDPLTNPHEVNKSATNGTAPPVEGDKDNKEAKDTKEPKPSLVDKLRAEREARANKAKEVQETNTIKGEYDKLKKEFEALKSSTKFEDDPVRYVKSRKLTPEQQLLLGETLIYDLAPDKAPPDLRQKLFEHRITREQAEREQAKARESQEAELKRINDSIAQFGRDLEQGVKEFPSGSYPESEDWFTTDTGDMDYEAYCRSLLATANNIATRAKQQGTIADLSPTNIAKTLEAALADKQAKREQRRAKKSAPKADTTTGNKTKPDEFDLSTSIDTTSTRGLNTRGQAENTMLTERERIQRAIRAGFGS